jgi:hypothetical protein
MDGFWCCCTQHGVDSQAAVAALHATVAQLQADLERCTAELKDARESGAAALQRARDEAVAKVSTRAALSFLRWSTRKVSLSGRLLCRIVEYSLLKNTTLHNILL